MSGISPDNVGRLFPKQISAFVPSRHWHSSDEEQRCGVGGPSSGGPDPAPPELTAQPRCVPLAAARVPSTTGQRGMEKWSCPTMTGRGERAGGVLPSPSASRAKQNLYSSGADLALAAYSPLQVIIPFGDITGTAAAAEVMSR